MNAPHPLAAYAKRAGVSLRELAARADTSATSLSRIITGKQTPSVALIRRLVVATDGEVTERDLVHGGAAGFVGPSEEGWLSEGPGGEGGQ